MNPYNCNTPGNLFVGYEPLRKEMLDGFRNGNSYAVLGGRRCGKTSLLIQIEKDLHATTLGQFHLLPRRISKHEFGDLTPNLLFEKIYEKVVQSVKRAKPWKKGESGKDYQTFLQHLKKANSVLHSQYGPNWLVILLFDELDALRSCLPDDQFFQNSRHLLMDSDFHRHFRLVATGVKGMTGLILAGSPLNNLCHKYLGILPDKSAQQLVEFGFPERTDTELLFTSTGKHPFLLQGLLGKLWSHKEEWKVWDEPTIKKAVHFFLRENNTFPRWINTFGQAEQAVYRCLAISPHGTTPIHQIRHNIDVSLRTEIDDARTVLSYHGVIIDDFGAEELRLAGTIFRDWFLENTVTTPPPNPYELEKSKLPFTLRTKIVEFLGSISSLYDNSSLRAFINRAGLDTQLQNQIKFDVPLAELLQIVVPMLYNYGMLEDGRNALTSILESAKCYVGQEGQKDCKMLIQELDKVASGDIGFDYKPIPDISGQGTNLGSVTK